MKKFYKIAFCGLGSIGKRHLKNTVKYLQDRDYSFQIDAIRSGVGKELSPDLASCITVQYSSQDVIPADYDMIFITNPTSMHVDSMKRYKACTRSMFIEKPVTDIVTGLDESLFQGIKCYVACPLRYTKVLQYVRQQVAYQEAYSVRAICSTYLPDWHPDEDYRKSYSAHKDMGGGVAIDLIHEWDYLTWLFGNPGEIMSIKRKISDLEVDSEDVALYLGSSDKVTFELHLDYFGREEMRMLEIFLPDDTVRADLHNGTIHFARDERTVTLEEDRDEYQTAEIEHFFDIYEGRCENDNTIEQAVKTLRMAQGG